MQKFWVILLMVFAATGCASTIESFYNRQVVQDQLARKDSSNEVEIGTLAVTSQRRLVVANLNTGRFCSEPPPESVDSINEAIAVALKANISGDEKFNADLASNFVRHAGQLYKRAHTVQLFRDAAYHYCINSVNSASDNNDSYESYSSEVSRLVDKLIPTLDIEVREYYEVERIRARSLSENH